MDTRKVAQYYREYGFIPFPLSAGSKEPPKGSSMANIERQWRFQPDSNIGLFAGSPNGLVIVDADNDESQVFMTNKLKEMGLWDWTTIVRTPKRGGLHFYLRVLDLPNDAQAYYKLPRTVGGGEFRVHRPAYVVAPGSAIPEGEYKFIQGRPRFFVEQPAFHWEDLTWLTKKVVKTGKERELVADPANSDLLALPYKPQRRDRPMVLKLFEVMRNTSDGERIPRLDYKTGQLIPDGYDTRSECEAAIVTGLLRSGWTFDEIVELFEDKRPGHYTRVPNKWRYLVSTYNSGVRYLSRICAG